MQLLQSLGYILVAAAVFVLVARSARIPAVVAYILAGLALGPLTGLLTPPEALDVVAEVGIVLLLFLVGLELRLDRIRDVGKVAVVAGIGQVVLTAAGGFLLSWLLGFGLIEAIFLGTALTFSSTVVVVKLLDQKGELHSLHGRIAVGILLVQDLVVIGLLTFLAGLGDPRAAEVPELVGGLATAFAGMGLLLLAALLSSRYLLPGLFGWAAPVSDLLFVWSLCWCFLFVLAARAMGLSLEIGAFLAGISLAQLPFNQELRRRVHPLVNFFLAVFFVSLGLRMEPGAATGYLGSAVALSLFVLIGKATLFMAIIARLGCGERTSFLTSASLTQISEFSFILAAMGAASGLIDGPILALIGLVGLATIAVSSYMILYDHELYDAARRHGLLRAFRARPEEPRPQEPPIRDHVIVIGMNALGRMLVEELVRRGERVLAIDTDPGKLAGLPCPTLLGNVDHFEVLEEAGLPRARLLVSALRIEDTNNLLAYRCRILGVPSSIHAFDGSVVEELREIGVSHLMLSRNVGVQRIAAELLKIVG